MNFLNKAKETANKLNENTKPINKPTLPGTKPTLPGKPPTVPVGKPPVGVPGKPPTIPGKPPTGAPNKPIIGKPPVSVQKPVEPEKETEIIEENNGPSPAPLAKNNPFKKTPTVPKEENKVDEKVEEAATEITEESQETKTEEIKEEIAAESTEEAKVEEKKTSKKGSRKKANKAESASEQSLASEKVELITENTLVIPKTQVEFDEAINSIKSGFVDAEWETFREENAKKLNEIVISNEMTTTMIKSTLSELSLMKDSIWLIFNDTKTMFENLTAKEPEGLIERIKKISSKGANPEERKLNATYAVMNYKDENGNTVNLYELLDEIRDRYNFTKSLMDGINYKNSVLITMLGSLKLEK